MKETNNQTTLIVAVVAAVAVVAVIGVILLGGGAGPAGAAAFDYSQIPQTRTEDGAFVLGNPAAPITVVEFADFTCPHCQDYESTMEDFIRQFVVPGLARFEYRMVGGTSSPYREYMSAIAECSDDLKPGSFWDSHDLIFEYARAGRYEEVVGAIAEQTGVTKAALIECSSTAKQFMTDVNVGAAAGVQGTPAVMIRLNGGDLSWINIGGQVLNRGGVPLEILATVVQSTP
ncbi:MAG: thioredoxin domain-containing protein [Anaerolineaceae bacterium]|nr:thioredoxin domain-containing protein [Anaerolineaceae bacterium]